MTDPLDEVVEDKIKTVKKPAKIDAAISNQKKENSQAAFIGKTKHLPYGVIEIHDFVQYDRILKCFKIRYSVPWQVGLKIMMLLIAWVGLLIPIGLLNVDALQQENPLFLCIAFIIAWIALEQIQQLIIKYPLLKRRIRLTHEEAKALRFDRVDEGWMIACFHRQWQHVANPIGFKLAQEYAHSLSEHQWP